MRHFAVVLVFFIATSALLGCGFRGSNIQTAEEAQINNEQELYEAAQKSIRGGNYSVGIERLEAIETHFPFGQFAEQAQLELIYANFMKGDYETATIAANRFIELHPTHPHADYAYFMRGLSSFNRNRGFFDRFLGSPEYTRDISNAKQAFVEFDEMLQKFPNSLYAKDAQQRMIYLRNVIAEHELMIAKFYLNNNTWVAAANRAAGIVENFPSSTTVPEALAVMVEANYKLGLSDPTNDALRVLALNFPNYNAFDSEGKLVLQEAIKNRDRSLANILTFGLLDRPEVPPPLEIKVESPSYADAETRTPQG